jgi:Membrane bound FAD containing D-sorbitol dehydrogenase
VSREPGEPVLTRRAFVGAGGALVAGVVLGGCGGSDTVSDEKRTSAFVALSSVVTGVPRLPRAHAPAYLAALDDAGLKVSPSDFLDKAGYLGSSGGPRTLAALESSEAFTQPGGEACARAIAGAWWSGTVTDAKKNTKLITYDDALVFRAMPWAKPQATCLGVTGAWSKRTKAA